VKVDPEADKAASLGSAALDGIAEGVVAVELDGRVRWLNTVGRRLLGLSQEAAAGRTLGEIFHLIDRKTGEPGPDPVAAALASDRPLPLEARHSLAGLGGAATPVVWTARVAQLADGRPCGVTVIFRDPEELTLTPDELVKANRLEALGPLAAGAGRELNERLMTITASLARAREPRGEAGGAAALNDAEQAASAAQALTRRLLAVAEHGAEPPVVCPARALLEEAHGLAAAGTEVRVAFVADAAVGEVRVDRGAVVQALHNLILNAREAMPPPPHRGQIQLRAADVELAAGQVPGLAAGPYVELTVRDNGGGIAGEQLPRIWEPFFTTKPHRTGLGLPTALSLVRKQGGQIALESTPGAGTALTIYLPRAARAGEPHARHAPAARFGTGRILVMDDDPTIAGLASAMLEALDYKVDLARDGEEAIGVYERYLNVGRPHDAVLLDLTVVGAMGGAEALGRLRALDPDVRAIAVGGDNREEAAAPALAAGFGGYLGKPYGAAELGRAIKVVVG
jgi:signal transduction histidine kinase/CheY-like chemotaxis protein